MFYQESRKAEERCDSSVSGPVSPVEQSKETRVITEDLLRASKDKFLRALEAQNRSLEELHQKADEVDQKVRQLSGKVGGAAVTPGGQRQKKQNATRTHKKTSRPLQVCGGHGATADGSCDDSPCGGAGCRDEQGNLACGGEGCNGTTGASVAALNLARNVSDSLTAAGEELLNVARKVPDGVF